MAIRCSSTLLLYPRTLILLHSASRSIIASNASEVYLESCPSLRREASSTPTSKKVPYLKSSLNKNPNSLIDFFKQIGLDDTLIGNIIKSHPRLLRTNVEKTLIPKIRVLQDRGISGSDLISVIASTPAILWSASSTTLSSKLDYLASTLGSVEEALNVLKRFSWLLSVSLTDRMQKNVELLRSYGVSREQIKKILLRIPRCLAFKPRSIEESLVSVEQMLGIPRDSAMFVCGFQATVSLSKKNLASKFEMFKKYGWSESDIMTMVWKMPLCLQLSEDKARSIVDFFINKLGYEPRFLAARPQLLMHSMEKRILPRYAVWQAVKEKKLMRRNVSLCTCLCMPESRFLDGYVLPFKDKLPGLYDAYMSKNLHAVANLAKE